MQEREAGRTRTAGPCEADQAGGASNAGHALALYAAQDCAVQARARRVCASQARTKRQAAPPDSSTAAGGTSAGLSSHWVASALATFAMARPRCGVLAGGSKDLCAMPAQPPQTKLLADAGWDEAVGAARRDAKQVELCTDDPAASRTCNALGGAGTSRGRRKARPRIGGGVSPPEPQGPGSLRAQRQSRPSDSSCRAYQA